MFLLLLVFGGVHPQNVHSLDIQTPPEKMFGPPPKPTDQTVWMFLGIN